MFMSVANVNLSNVSGFLSLDEVFLSDSVDVSSWCTFRRLNVFKYTLVLFTIPYISTVISTYKDLIYAHNLMWIYIFFVVFQNLSPFI